MKYPKGFETVWPVGQVSSYEICRDVNCGSHYAGITAGYVACQALEPVEIEGEWWVRIVPCPSTLETPYFISLRNGVERWTANKDHL